MEFFSALCLIIGLIFIFISGYILGRKSIKKKFQHPVGAPKVGKHKEKKECCKSGIYYSSSGNDYCTHCGEMIREYQA